VPFRSCIADCIVKRSARGQTLVINLATVVATFGPGTPEPSRCGSQWTVEYGPVAAPSRDTGIAARWRRRVLILSAVLLAGASVTVPALRTPILRAAGRALVVADPLEPADIIVVAVDAGGAGVLEASDLVHGGIATRVAVLADPPSEVDREFLRRGIPYEDAAARSVRQFTSLGVERIEQIPRAVVGSEDEGLVLPAWCDQHQFRSVVVVSTADHSRRLRRILRRSMKGHQTIVTVRSSRYSAFDPDRWWTTRDGTRTEIVEIEKLGLDVLRHTIS
jgi:hypothetical protein